MTERLTVITGGTRGIGAAAAETTYAVCRHGVRCRAVRCDVTTDEGIETLFATAAGLGRVTGLVNNAGATYHIGPLAETDADTVRRTVDLNLTASLLCARRAVQLMSRAKGGSGGVIVNVSSGAATLGSPGEYVTGTTLRVAGGR